MTPAEELAAVQAERTTVHATITDLYWTFTRTARGKTPCVVRPDLYTRRNELDARARELRAAMASPTQALICERLRSIAAPKRSPVIA